MAEKKDSKPEEKGPDGKEPRKMRGWMSGSDPGGGDEKGPPTGGSGVSKKPG